MAQLWVEIWRSVVSFPPDGKLAGIFPERVIPQERLPGLLWAGGKTRGNILVGFDNVICIICGTGWGGCFVLANMFCVGYGGIVRGVVYSLSGWHKKGGNAGICPNPSVSSRDCERI